MDCFMFWSQDCAKILFSIVYGSFSVFFKLCKMFLCVKMVKDCIADKIMIEAHAKKHSKVILLYIKTICDTNISTDGFIDACRQQHL